MIQSSLALPVTDVFGGGNAIEMNGRKCFASQRWLKRFVAFNFEGLRENLFCNRQGRQGLLAFCPPYNENFREDRQILKNIHDVRAGL